MIESIEVNTRQKAQAIIDALRKQGRAAHYMEFFISYECDRAYVIYYRAKGE